MFGELNCVVLNNFILLDALQIVGCFAIFLQYIM